VKLILLSTAKLLTILYHLQSNFQILKIKINKNKKSLKK